MKPHKVLLFTSKYEGKYYPEEMIWDLEKFYSGLEYGDVKEGEYQIWEFPSAYIYSVEADGAVLDKDHYSTPSEGRWLPTLKSLGVDREKVTRGIREYLDKVSTMPQYKSLNFDQAYIKSASEEQLLDLIQRLRKLLAEG